jgi:carotenoid cleavage dioxygenase-like enzyme
VPAPSATSEDDGVLVSCVMGSDGTSFMVLLDGRTMAEVARARVPYAVPYRFHGGFVRAK